MDCHLSLRARGLAVVVALVCVTVLPSASRAEGASCVFLSAEAAELHALTPTLAEQGCAMYAGCSRSFAFVEFANQSVAERVLQEPQELCETGSQVTVCESGVQVAHSLAHLLHHRLSRPLSTAGLPLEELWVNRDGIPKSYRTCRSVSTSAFNLVQRWCTGSRRWLCVCTESATQLEPTATPTDTATPTATPTDTATPTPTGPDPASAAPSEQPTSAPTHGETTAPSASPTVEALISAQDEVAFAMLDAAVNRSEWTECSNQGVSVCEICNVQNATVGVECAADGERRRRLQEAGPGNGSAPVRVKALKFRDVGVVGPVPVEALRAFTALDHLDISSVSGAASPNLLELPPGASCVDIPRCREPGVTCLVEPLELCQEYEDEVLARGGAQASGMDEEGGTIMGVVGGVLGAAAVMAAAFVYYRSGEKKRNVRARSWTAAGKHFEYNIPAAGLSLAEAQRERDTKPPPKRRSWVSEGFQSRFGAFFSPLPSTADTRSDRAPSEFDDVPLIDSQKTRPQGGRWSLSGLRALLGGEEAPIAAVRSEDVRSEVDHRTNSFSYTNPAYEPPREPDAPRPQLVSGVPEGLLLSDHIQ